MPQKQVETLHALNRELLAKELDSLKQVLRKSRQKAVPDSMESADALELEQGALALIRLFQGISHKDWAELAEEHDLKDWLAMPVSQDAYPFITELQKNLEELAYRSEHDPLTGLYNKRAFQRAMENELERAKRGGTSISLAVLNIDDFRRINDGFGHDCGDEVLTQYSKLLLSGTRRYDITGRIGGEEFGILLPATGLIKTGMMLDRLLATIRSHSFMSKTKGKLPQITCSIGFICYKGHGEITAEEMVEAAESALGEAKKDGKNCVKTAPFSGMAPASRKTLVESDEKMLLFTSKRSGETT
jgi:diguanylate cyclase (GGDEF)-like protein